MPAEAVPGPGRAEKKLIEQARSQGMADDKIAKMFPKTIVLGKSKARGAGPKMGLGQAQPGVTLADGTKYFWMKGKQSCCREITDVAKQIIESARNKSRIVVAVAHIVYDGIRDTSVLSEIQAQKIENTAKSYN